MVQYTTIMALFDKFPIMNLLAEEIFLSLDLKSLTSCQFVNKSWNAYLANPRFWFRKTLCEEFQKYKSSSIVQDKFYQLANRHWLEIINATSRNNLDLKVEMIKCLKKRMSNTWKPFSFRQKVPEYENISPIFLASELGDLDLVKHILEFTNPKDVFEIENEDGKINPKVVPIHFAAKNGRLEVMKYLINTFEVQKPNHFVDKTNRTAMIYAAQNGHSRIVKHLLKYPRNADCNSVEIALQNRNYKSAFLLDKKTTICYFTEDITLLGHLTVIAFLAFIVISIAAFLDFTVHFDKDVPLVQQIVSHPLIFWWVVSFLVFMGLSAIHNSES